MPAQKTSAHEKPSTLRIATARRTQLDELYLAYDVAGVKPLELEAIERHAIASASVGCGGAAVTMRLDSGGLLEERITVLTSLTRGDRVRAAVYMVRIGDNLCDEFPITVGGPYAALGRLASRVACHVL